jgi:hypothetical protein
LKNTTLITAEISLDAECGDHRPVGDDFVLEGMLELRACGLVEGCFAAGAGMEVFHVLMTEEVLTRGLEVVPHA